MTKNLTTRVSALEGAVANLTDGQREILAILRGTSTAPVVTPEVVVTAPAPVIAGSFGEKECQGCGKALLRSFALCKACAKKGTTEVVTSTGTSRRLRSVQAVVEPTVKAKDGRGRDASAHCGVDGCTKFSLKATGTCREHVAVLAAQNAPEEVFLTLEDGSKYGYRVPADLVLRLRKARLSDEVIVKAAKAQGLGRKASKDKVVVGVNPTL